MPRPEDQPPESIVVGQFIGMRNNLTRERLMPGELEKALNVDIDDSGQVRRRRGYTQKLTGGWHSPFTWRDETYAVKDGELGIITPGYVFNSLMVVGSDPLSYTAVDETMYFSSRSAAGKVTGGAVYPWGSLTGSGVWLSPVITPSATLGAIAGQQLNNPPLAEHIVAYKGRIYLANGKTLWATELYLYDVVDRTRNFIQFESDITMLGAVDDGLVVGTEDGLYYLAGTLSTGLKQVMINDSAPVPGSAVYMPSSKVYPQARDSVPQESTAMVFLTDQGVCAVFNGGQLFNLTHTNMAFPKAVRAAGLYREQDGVNQYLATADTAGTPTAQVRIGDYVEAEIVRFQGG